MGMLQPLLQGGSKRFRQRVQPALLAVEYVPRGAVSPAGVSARYTRTQGTPGPDKVCAGSIQSGTRTVWNARDPTGFQIFLEAAGLLDLSL